MQRIAFLLGSGVSSSAGMPSTGELTGRVLSGAGVRRHPDGAYYFDAAHSDAPADGSVLRIRRFLHRLKAEIDGYYRDQPEHHTDYEDLYYAASQIHDSELREYDNPAVQPFIDKIRADVEPLLAGDAGAPAWSLLELSSEATHYIRDVVWRLLCAEPSRADHMESLSAACLDDALSCVDIFTLNHDTVLEQLLSRNGIRVTDGFDQPVERIRYWNPDLFMRPDARVRLFKLHGSVNWFRLRPPDGNGELIGMPLNWDFRHGEPVPDRTWPTGGRPLFLAGTFNKILQYTSDIYADLHYQFRNVLREAEHLLVCGYSFGDKGINGRIIEWMHSAPSRRLLVAHPQPEELKGKARPRIARYWDEWQSQGRLTPIAKGIEELSWPEIKAQLR